ncbi:hypothetical protein KCU95_g18216, partial [Aureobasidium melanogenum]
MSATDVPTKDRSPEQPSSLPPERRCERTGDDHNPDLSCGEDEGIASVADIQMADSPTPDGQPSGPQEDHASEPDYDRDNAANLNESDV